MPSKGLSKDFIKKTEQALIAEQQKLQRELASLQGASEDKHTTDDSNSNASEDESAAGTTERNEAASLLNELATALRDVEKTLARLAKGDYGKCKYCGEMIDERRLLARPTSTSCVACKKMLTQEM